MTDREYEERLAKLSAALHDGELADPRLIQEVEAWLDQNPDAQAQLEGFRHLDALMRKSAPEEPSDRQWASTCASIRRRCRIALANAKADTAANARAAGRRNRYAGYVAVAFVLFAIGASLWLPSLFNQPAVEEPDLVQIVAPPTPRPSREAEPLLVAVGDEVEILRVEGEDTSTLVVGQLPILGPLELAKRDDIVVGYLRPDANDNMVPEVRLNDSLRLLIWARDVEPNP